MRWLREAVKSDAERRKKADAVQARLEAVAQRLEAAVAEASEHLERHE